MQPGESKEGCEPLFATQSAIRVVSLQGRLGREKSRSLLQLLYYVSGDGGSIPDCS